MANLFEIGTKQLEQGEFNEAILSFTKYLENDPQNVNVICLRGVAYRKVDRYQDSISDFEAAAKIIPTNANIYSELGVTLFHLKDLEGSLLNMNKSQELEPENSYRYSSRAYIKDSIGDLDGAIADYKKCIELDPEDAVAYNNLGMLEEKQGRISAAKERFKKADEISKEESSPFFGKFNAEGDKVLDESDAKQEVSNVIKEALAKAKSEKKQTKNIKITPVEKPSIGKAMLAVFKSKQEFKAFIRFVRNGFKLDDNTN
tara:strand:- start:190 stop:966 length:777 start_codon:yes stop_codon:yes gene_type:complete